MCVRAYLLTSSHSEIEAFFLFHIMSMYMRLTRPLPLPERKIEQRLSFVCIYLPLRAENGSG